jgi:endonuclease/exonuclease/phosphatase family metal-dependent hydrolase
MTDVNIQEGGNSERIAFLFDRRRVIASGLACELVVPKKWLADVAGESTWRQFVRTPYAASFRISDATFILVSLHIDYGQSDDRVPELRAIAEFMRDWADRTNRWGHNLITLGDFNIDRKDDDLWKAFTSTGLHVPDDLNVAKTIFADPNEPENGSFYDQVAWFETGSGKQRINVTFNQGGNFDWVPLVYTELGLPNSQVQWRVSDHYPLWCEFGV